MKTKIKTNGRYFTKLRKKQNLTIKELSLKNRHFGVNAVKYRKRQSHSTTTNIIKIS